MNNKFTVFGVLFGVVALTLVWAFCNPTDKIIPTVLISGAVLLAAQSRHDEKVSLEKRKEVCLDFIGNLTSYRSLMFRNLLHDIDAREFEIKLSELSELSASSLEKIYAVCSDKTSARTEIMHRKLLELMIESVTLKKKNGGNRSNIYTSNWFERIAEHRKEVICTFRIELGEPKANSLMKEIDITKDIYSKLFTNIFSEDEKKSYHDPYTYK
ncbi:hypothetical protein [Shewanella sp. 4_MG-2023]|uniref:hypothetical protein n=1 Tax=Shewanella sp. 4_MG-2023 TaxID=3062652 RepID=UPI0026E16283|nr:hypothetical protein [Shewanella sp. 4_MG-2023]MDO6677701.1 hypothetical protein [Shewanella sp. 4_MG-2023]